MLQCLFWFLLLFCRRIWRGQVSMETVASDLCCPEDHPYVHLHFSGCYSQTVAHSHAFSRPQGLPGLPGPPGPQVDALMDICTKRNLAYMICQYCKNICLVILPVTPRVLTPGNQHLENAYLS